MTSETKCSTTIGRSSPIPQAQWVVHGSLIMLIMLNMLIMAVVTVASGCQKPLFADKAPRTQFDTYDKLRQQNQSLLVPDEFGNPQPALRARLSPQN